MSAIDPKLVARFRAAPKFGSRYTVMLDIARILEAHAEDEGFEARRVGARTIAASIRASLSMMEDAPDCPFHGNAREPTKADVVAELGEAVAKADADTTPGHRFEDTPLSPRS